MSTKSTPEQFLTKRVNFPQISPGLVIDAMPQHVLSLVCVGRPQDKSTGGWEK